MDCKVTKLLGPSINQTYQNKKTTKHTERRKLQIQKIQKLFYKTKIHMWEQIMRPGCFFSPGI